MIACLGWGSLIWKPGKLALDGGWRTDGPCVKVEFARQSDDGRLTLVLHDKADPVPSLWASMTGTSLDDAAEALRKRENTASKWIGRWSRGNEDPRNILNLGAWASTHDVDHVIWTALGPRFGDGELAPTEDQAIAYLGKLSGKTAKCARQYVRCAPQQVDTAYRRRIALCLGWTASAAECE